MPSFGDDFNLLGAGSAFGLFVFVALAFGTLTYAFIVSDFSILDVASNSNTLKPLVYKISGVWGNHEGSMLLWVLVLALYAAMVAGLKRGGERLTSAALGVQGLVVKAHGRSNARAIRSALMIAHQAAAQDLLAAFTAVGAPKD